MSDAIAIRAARRVDVPLLFTLVKRLAAYERAPERVTGSEALLEDALFGPRALAQALIAAAGGEPAGFALFYETFSTWQCLRGMWLEDLYVEPEHRRAGVGRELLAAVAQLSVERGYGRLEWSALDWNTPALRFYDQLGAERLSEWEVFRLEGAALERLGDRAAGSA